MLDVVVVLELHARDADTAAALLAVGGQRHPLDVPRLGHGDDHLLVGDEVLDVDVVLGVGDLRAAVAAVGVADLEQLLLDHAQHARLVAEDRAQLLDPLHEVGVLLLDLAGLQRGEALQPEVEDGLRLLA